MENEWKIDGKLMENKWKIDGKLMENWWKIGGKSMDFPPIFHQISGMVGVAALLLLQGITMV